jgi:hypothetical protein
VLQENDDVAKAKGEDLDNAEEAGVWEEEEEIEEKEPRLSQPRWVCIPPPPIILLMDAQLIHLDTFGL